MADVDGSLYDLMTGEGSSDKFQAYDGTLEFIGSFDGTKPIVDNQDPTPGSDITPDTPLTFDVHDDSGMFRALMVFAYFPTSGAKELIHDGTSFNYGYRNNINARTTLGSNLGYHYIVKRDGGWSDVEVEIQVAAIDLQGNEND